MTNIIYRLLVDKKCLTQKNIKKERTRQSILKSARELFSSKGFNAVTINEVMQNCSLTRGAFYIHFDNKPDLYNQALEYSATNSELTKTKPKEMPSKEWLGQLLDQYLSVEHVSGEEPCSLAFLATDIVSQDKIAKQTYVHNFKNMNKAILKYAGKGGAKGEKEILALTSMIIGAVAVARTINDKMLVQKILNSCRQQARLILGEI